MELSSRNQLSATVTEVRLGTVMAEVTMRLSDGQELVSAITRRSAERLDLSEGDQVTAFIKATEVLIGK